MRFGATLKCAPCRCFNPARKSWPFDQVERGYGKMKEDIELTQKFKDVLSVVKVDFDFFRAMSFTSAVDCF
jgi:hypothetical protein